MYQCATPGECPWYAPWVYMGRSQGVPGGCPGITVAKVTNLFECELVPNYLQRFRLFLPFY